MSSPTWRTPRRHQSPTRRSHGQALVELALILPIFLLLIAGAIDLGRLFYAYVAIVNASKEGAFFGATSPICDVRNALCPDPLNVAFRVQTEVAGLRDAGGSAPRPTVTCLAPGGGARASLRDCVDGDTYRVGVDYSFRLITPILGSLLDRGLTLHAQSDATVLNKAFDPNPGLSVVKMVKSEKGAWERTPIPDPKTGQPVYREFTTSETAQYRIVVRNSGAVTLTGIALADDPDKYPSSCPLHKTMPPGDSFQCDYSVKLDDEELDGQPFVLRDDTVTVDAKETSPVQDGAVIKIVADPPELAVSKSVNVFRNDPPFGSDDRLDVSINGKVHPTVWYRIVVRNIGGLPATNLTVQDSFGPLPNDPDCRRPPSTLGPNDTYACFYARTFNGPGDFGNTVTVDSQQTAPVRASATVEVRTCGSPDLVVPNLVEDPSGDPRKVAQARSLWSSAGFTGQFRPSGNDNDEVTSQDRPPFDCRASSSTVTVGHR